MLRLWKVTKLVAFIRPDSMSYGYSHEGAHSHESGNAQPPNSCSPARGATALVAKFVTGRYRRGLETKADIGLVFLT